MVVACFAVVVTACNNASSSNPKAVVKDFFDKMAKKDIEGASKLATKESKTTLDMMKKGMDAAQKEAPAEKDEMAEEFGKLEFGDAKVTGETATVPVTHKEKKEQMEISLKKEDGDWKVDFSMATLMKMGKSQGGMDEDTDMSAEDKRAADSILNNMTIDTTNKN